MTSEDTAVATGGAVGAAAVGIGTFLSNGPIVTPEVFLIASAFGGITGGILSSLGESGPLKARSLITIAGYGALLGSAIVSSLLYVFKLSPTIQAVGVMSGVGGTLAWTVSKALPIVVKPMMKKFLAGFGFSVEGEPK